MSTGIRQVRDTPTSAGMAGVLDALGRRWALRVIWELKAGPLKFRDLQAACDGISPSVLQRRVNELRSMRVLEAIPRLGYRLTAAGEQLFPVLAALNKWSEVHRPDLHVGDKPD